MDVTDDVRRAILAENCARHGHSFDISEAISNDPTIYPGENTVHIRANMPGVIPHITCKNCHHVWLIVEESGFNYMNAVEQLCDRLHPNDPLHDRPKSKDRPVEPKHEDHTH